MKKQFVWMLLFAIFIIGCSDLKEFLNEDEKEDPSIIREEDGVQLFYNGDLNTFENHEGFTNAEIITSDGTNLSYGDVEDPHITIQIAGTITENDSFNHDYVFIQYNIGSGAYMNTYLGITLPLESLGSGEYQLISDVGHDEFGNEDYHLLKGKTAHITLFKLKSPHISAIAVSGALDVSQYDMKYRPGDNGGVFMSFKGSLLPEDTETSDKGLVIPDFGPTSALDALTSDEEYVEDKTQLEGVQFIDPDTESIYFATGELTAYADSGIYNYEDQSSSYSTGSCNVPSADICADYSGMSEVQYNTQKSKCDTGGIWSTSNDCASHLTSKTQICQQSSDGATVKTYYYQIESGDIEFFQSNCTQYQGTVL